MKRKKPVPPAETQPKVGRPKTGKRSNPDYQQVSAIVRRDTYREVMNVLYVEKERAEFSQLVQELLERWLNSKTRPLKSDKR